MFLSSAYACFLFPFFTLFVEKTITTHTLTHTHLLTHFVNLSDYYSIYMFAFTIYLKIYIFRIALLIGLNQKLQIFGKFFKF